MSDDPLAQQASLYEAGGKMGKAGAVGGWYFKYKIPFQVSIVAQIRLIISDDRSGDYFSKERRQRMQQITKGKQQQQQQQQRHFSFSDRRGNGFSSGSSDTNNNNNNSNNNNNNNNNNSNNNNNNNNSNNSNNNNNNNNSNTNQDDENSNGCQYAYVQIRGHEVRKGDRGVVLPSGMELPRSARMQVQRIDNTTFPPLSLVSLANISQGMAAVLFQSTMALSTYPPMNNYIEGCFHLLRTANESFPGLVVGTGFEDFYNSAYWFGAASGYKNGVLFQQADSGLVHYSVGSPLGPEGVEMLSAYRFLDAEVMGVADGGRLLWRVGDTDGKCFDNTTSAPIGTPSAVAVKSCVWLYQWPNDLSPVQPLPPLPQLQHISYRCENNKCVLVHDGSGDYLFANCDEECNNPPPPPPPPSPPGPPAVVGCSSGECSAFCNVSTTVHGCLANWPGSASMRAPPKMAGAPCGGSTQTTCATPADACAVGWSPCLSNFSKPGLDVASFRNGFSAALCSGTHGVEPSRRFLAAMSHARPEWSSLPPNPCPAAVITTDNGCISAGWGAEPVCCGGGCTVPSCPNAVWLDQTRIHVDENAACDAVSSDAADGVLCCKLL